MLCLCAPAWVIAAPADEVKALLEAGKASEAYLLAKKYPDALGDPGFDFYFGIASIDAGNAGEGVLALERYILTFPDNVAARLQLARGYFALGEDARAREEFEALQKLGPPADVSATIDRFLDAIRLRETRYTPIALGPGVPARASCARMYCFLSSLTLSHPRCNSAAISLMVALRQRRPT